MYDKAIREEAAALLLAGHSQAEVSRIMLERHGITIPRQTLSLWHMRFAADAELRERAEQYRADNDARLWYNIGQAQELLRRQLGGALDDTEKIDEAIETLCSLTDHGMFDEATTARAAGAIDLLHEVRNLVSVRDALAVVKDLGAQSARSEQMAAGAVSGTFQLCFDGSEEIEDLCK